MVNASEKINKKGLPCQNDLPIHVIRCESKIWGQKRAHSIH